MLFDGGGANAGILDDDEDTVLLVSRAGGTVLKVFGERARIVVGLVLLTRETSSEVYEFQ